MSKTIVVHDHRYTTEIRPLVRLGLQRARKLFGFRALGRPRLEMCGSLRCAGWRPVATRLGRLYFTRRRRGRPARLIEFTELKRYLAWRMNLQDFGLEDKSGSDVAIAKQIGFAWVLRHRWGRREIVVINLSHRYFGSSNEKGWTVRKCLSVETCVPPEPDGDHQLGIDVLMVLDPKRPTQVVTSTALPKSAPSSRVPGTGAP